LTFIRLESKLYNEQHTKKVLEEERRKEVSELSNLRGLNLQSDRTIKQMRTFTSKKDEKHAKMKADYDDLNK